MSDRIKLIDGFLTASPWANWTRHPLAGDASARRYERLSQNGESVILMDAPASDGEDTKSFAKIASFLLDEGLSPPQILAHDPENGLMILSDLGRDDFAGWLKQRPQDANTLYTSAIDVLAQLNTCDADLDLTALTPAVGGQMIEILNPFYTENAVGDLTTEMTHCLEELAPEPSTLALRDFHAENLIWRPHLQGLNRVGLLDFQDALLAPAGYDLASLLRDVRRDVSTALAEDMIAYFSSKTQAKTSFRAQLACLGVQRNLRILGVFARLAKARSKPYYVDLIPRVWRNLMTDLAHPALTKLKQAVNDTLPPPDPAHLASLRP